MNDRIPLPHEDRATLAAQIYARYLKTQHELPNVPMVMREEVRMDLQDGVEDDTFDETCVLPPHAGLCGGTW